MDLFGWKSKAKIEALEKEISGFSRITKNHGFYGAGSGGFDASGFRQFVQNGILRIEARQAYQLYDRSAPLANVVDRIVEAVADLTPVVKTADNEVVATSKTLDVLRQPGFGQSYQQFISDYALAFLLVRNAYLITDQSKVTIRTPKPFLVDPELNRNDGFIGIYRVTSDGGGQRQFLRQDSKGQWQFIDQFNQELSHLKGQTRDDGLLGRSPIEAILIDIAQGIEGGKHNLSVLQNGLRTDGAFTSDTTLTKEQFARTTEQVDEQYVGSHNAGRPMLLDGGMKYLEMSRTNKEMDYATLLRHSESMIAQRYRVPLPIVLPEQMTLANYTTAVQALYDDAVFPLAETLFNAIGFALAIEEGQVLTFDRDDVPAIRERRIDEAAKRHAIGIFSANETRAGLSKEPFEGGDVVYQPSTLVAVGDEDGAEDDGDIEDEEKAFITAAMNQGLNLKGARAVWAWLDS